MYSRKHKREKENFGRINIALAVIFLFGAILLFRLFELQVIDFDYYSAIAEEQHEVFNELKPKRGEIFLKDDQNDQSQLYPAATNKEFATIYAIPKDVEKPEEIAEDLYLVFDQSRVQKEIEKLFFADPFFDEILDKAASDIEDGKVVFLSSAEKSEKMKFWEVKKELEEKTRKEEVVNNYLQKLEKPNDPFEPIRKKVSEQDLAAIMDKHYKGIDFLMQENRYYPEEALGAHLLGFVGYIGDEAKGRYGLEGFFDDELSGRQGTVKAGRSATGDVIIVNDREYQKAVDGADLVLTIQRPIQFEVCEKLKNAVEKYDAENGSVIVMDPFSGAILAMCSYPSYDPNQYNEVENINIYNNPAIFDAYEPGSIFKAFTLAAGLNENVIEPNSVYEDKGFVYIDGWPKPIKNSDFATRGGHGWVDMVTVLEASLNTGTIFVMNRVGAEKFAGYVKNFGFGEKTGIELETEGLTNVANLERKHIRPVEAATASFGQGITATPLQIIAAYSAIANGGILMKPYLVDEIRMPDGTANKTQPQQIRRVITEKTALLLSGMLVNVIEGGHAKHAAVPGYFVAGKTGTAQMADEEKGGYSEDKTAQTFVGYAPVEEPKFAMLVKLQAPKKSKFADGSTAPVFSDMAQFILNYYQVPKER